MGFCAAATQCGPFKIMQILGRAAPGAALQRLPVEATRLRRPERPAGLLRPLSRVWGLARARGVTLSPQEGPQGRRGVAAFPGPRPDGEGALRTPGRTEGPGHFAAAPSAALSPERPLRPTTSAVVPGPSSPSLPRPFPPSLLPSLLRTPPPLVPSCLLPLLPPLPLVRLLSLPLSLLLTLWAPLSVLVRDRAQSRGQRCPSVPLSPCPRHVVRPLEEGPPPAQGVPGARQGRGVPCTPTVAGQSSPEAGVARAEEDGLVWGRGTGTGTGWGGAGWAAAGSSCCPILGRAGVARDILCAH